MHQGNPFLSKSKHCAACLHNTKQTWPCSPLHKQKPCGQCPRKPPFTGSAKASGRTFWNLAHPHSYDPRAGGRKWAQWDKTAGRDNPTARSALTGERLTTTPQSRAPDGHLGKAPALDLEGWVLGVLSFDVLTKWPKNYRVSSWPSLAKSQKKSQFYLKTEMWWHAFLLVSTELSMAPDLPQRKRATFYLGLADSCLYVRTQTTVFIMTLCRFVKLNYQGFPGTSRVW